MILYSIAIILLVNDLFFLLPFEIPVKNRDLALLLILIGFVWVIFVKRENLEPFKNIFSVLFVTFLVYCLVQIPLASFYYDQSIRDGIVFIRTYFYYLSFFFFLLIFKSIDDYARLFNVLSVLAVFLFALALVDYSGIKVFHGQFSDNVSMRAGIERAEVPGMNIFSFVFLWQLSYWTYPQKGHSVLWARLLTLLFFVVHIFRQGRFRLFSILAGGLGLLILQGRIRALFAVLGFATIVVLGITFFSNTNLLTSMFVSGAEETFNQEGTAEDRVEQLRVDYEVFQKHPLLGSGSAALRLDRNDLADEKLKGIARSADLGYVHWIKHFGIVGMVWLAAFFISMYVYVRKLKTDTTPDRMVFHAFSGSYVIYLVVSFLTLNHLMFPDSIVLTSLFCAMLVRLSMPYREVDAYG